MLVKNIGSKVVGFGSLVLLPDETKELPVGFDDKHPLVKWYLDTGWLSNAGRAVANDIVETVADEPVSEDDGLPKGFDTLPLNEKISAVKKMNLAPLKRRATKLGIEYNDATVTRKVLIERIIAKMEAEGV